MNDDWNDDSDMVEEWAEGDFDPMEARRGGGRSKGSGVITIMRKRAFDYTFLNAGTTSIVLKRAIPVIPYFYYTLMVRVHNLDIEHASSYLRVEAYNTLPTKQDPREFTVTSAAVLTASITSTDAAGTLEIIKTNDQGAFFKVLLNVNQGANDNRLYGELSAVLLCRALA